MLRIRRHISSGILLFNRIPDPPGHGFGCSKKERELLSRLRARVGVHLLPPCKLLDITRSIIIVLSNGHAWETVGVTDLSLATGQSDVYESAGVCEPLLRTALGGLGLLLLLDL